MQTRRMTRETLLPLLAAHVLEHGISSASLRPLAKAAGTSDRMLIYHFGNKQGVIDAVLRALAAQFTAGLDSALPAEPAANRQETAARILAITSQSELEPFLRLWWEIVAEAAGGSESFRETAARTMGSLLAWLEAHMPAGDPDPAAGARLVLTLIEGAQMLDAIGRGDIGTAAIEALER